MQQKKLISQISVNHFNENVILPAGQMPDPDGAQDWAFGRQTSPSPSHKVSVQHC